MGQTETTTIGNTASAHHSLTKSNNVTIDFIFDDVSYSFSGLNWNVDTIKCNNFWILGDLEKRVSPFLFTFISCLIKENFFYIPCFSVWSISKCSIDICRGDIFGPVLFVVVFLCSSL